MTIQDLYEWANENDALNEPVSIPDNYDGWTLAEGAGGRRMKEYVPVAKDCEHCTKKRGSFGCCSTVSNNWVYSCAEGQKEWALDKMRAEIKTMSGDIETIADALQIIDKYREGSEGKK